MAKRLLMGVFALCLMLGGGAGAAAAANDVPDVLTRLNQERQSRSLPQFFPNDLLARAAQVHADDLALRDLQSHIGADGSNPGDRVRRAGYHWALVGEAVAFGDSVPEMITGWMNDPAHRDVIVNPNLRQFGGASTRNAAGRTYWVVKFATPFVPPLPPPPVTRPVGSGGGQVQVGAGGAGFDSGVTVIFPPGALPDGTVVTVTVTNAAPPGVFGSGGMLLPKTIEVTTDTGAPLNAPVEIQINFTGLELAGLKIDSLQGGVVNGLVLDPLLTRVIDPAGGVIGITADHFSKFSVITIQSAGPGMGNPPNGTTLDGLGVTLRWTNPPGTTQYQLQVVPFAGDGPGVNVIRNVDTSFVVPAPPAWYGLLPDMTYYWRVRTTKTTVPPQDLDWTAWGSWGLKTPKVTSATISPVAPAVGSLVSTLTPDLTWASTDTGVFYYELQASEDPTFNTDAATATAMVYSVLLHGGVTTPLNTYRIPLQFPLQPGSEYHWRVRPRIQGDGVAVAWSPVWHFKTP